MGRVLINSLLRECTVDVIAELGMVHHVILGYVLVNQVLELIVSKLEVKHGENAFELVWGHFALSQFVKIFEKLLYSNSLHNNQSLYSIFNVVWTVRNVDGL